MKNPRKYTCVFAGIVSALVLTALHQIHRLNQHWFSTWIHWSQQLFVFSTVDKRFVPKNLCFKPIQLHTKFIAVAPECNCNCFCRLPAVALAYCCGSFRKANLVASTDYGCSFFRRSLRFFFCKPLQLTSQTSVSFKATALILGSNRFTV